MMNSDQQTIDQMRAIAAYPAMMKAVQSVLSVHSECQKMVWGLVCLEVLEDREDEWCMVCKCQAAHLMATGKVYTGPPVLEP